MFDYPTYERPNHNSIRDPSSVLIEARYAKVISMQLALSNWIRVLLGTLFILFVFSSLAPQETQINALAEQMAESLAHSKQKMVAVFAFVGPDETEALGQKLADEFREALVKSAHSFRVEDSSRFLGILGKNGALSASIDDANTASWFLRDSDADTSILGTVSDESGGLKISV